MQEPTACNSPTENHTENLKNAFLDLSLSFQFKDIPIPNITQMIPAEQFTQAQVLEEVEIFEPVHSLVDSQPWQPQEQANEPKHFRNPSPSFEALPNTQIDHLFYCTLHSTYALENREQRPMGTLLQMPCQRWICLQWCVHWVLPSDLYRALPNQSLQCYCKCPLIMTVSHTEKNPERLFLKCSQRPCDFFQWVDREAKGKNKAWLKGSTTPWTQSCGKRIKKGMQHGSYVKCYVKL